LKKLASRKKLRVEKIKIRKKIQVENVTVKITEKLQVEKTKKQVENREGIRITNATSSKIAKKTLSKLL
jgi:hypothetical protein